MDSVSALSGRGLISDDQRTMLAGFCRRWDCSPFEALIEANMISESEFADHAADLSHLPRVKNVRMESFDEISLDLLPFPFARRRVCIVLGSDDSGEGRVVRVAIADPWDNEARLLVEGMVPAKVQWCVGERSDIIEAIDRHFPFSSIVPHFWEALAGNALAGKSRD